MEKRFIVLLDGVFNNFWGAGTEEDGSCALYMGGSDIHGLYDWNGELEDIEDDEEIMEKISEYYYSIQEHSEKEFNRVEILQVSGIYQSMGYSEARDGEKEEEIIEENKDKCMPTMGGKFGFNYTLKELADDIMTGSGSIREVCAYETNGVHYFLEVFESNDGVVFNMVKQEGLDENDAEDLHTRHVSKEKFYLSDCVDTAMLYTMIRVMLFDCCMREGL